MQKLEWHNEKRKLKDLVVFESNPRQLSKEQYEQLKKSLEKFNLAEVPAIDTDNKICAGHQRIKVLLDLYGKEHKIDVRVPNRKLSKKEFEEYNIRSNKNTGTWDFDILANEFEMDMLFDVGFTKIELGMIEGTDFPQLKDGDREPFQQMTFTLADQQAKIIQQALKDSRAKEDFNYCETYQNENSNGNALYFIVSQWLTLSK